MTPIGYRLVVSLFPISLSDAVEGTLVLVIGAAWSIGNK